MDEPTADSAPGAMLSAAVLKYERDVIRYAQHLAGNPEEARDLAQEAFARLAGEASVLSLNGRLKPWLLTVVRNLAIDRSRRRQSMKLVGGVEPVRVESPAPSPAMRVAAKESQARVMELLELLPAIQQECLRLRFQQGLSYRQIADVTGKSVSHVGVIIHEGLRSLRERMADHA